MMFSQENQILVALRRIMRAVDLHSRRLFEEFGLTGPQLAVLQEADRLVSASATALARAVHLSSATVTGILDRLERGGFLQRVRSEVDRRAITIHVTDAGRRVLRESPSLLQDQFRKQLESLEEWERTQILATLQRIGAMMAVNDLDAGPVLAAGPLTSPPADDGAQVVHDAAPPALPLP